MSDAIEGVTAVDGTQDRSSSQSDPYDWFYNPEYAQGINKGTENLMSQVKQGQEEEQNYENQIAEIWGGPAQSDVKSF